MKMAKRIVIGLLVVALTVAGLAFTALAEDNVETDAPEYDLDKYAAVLEYYEEDVFYDDTYEDLGVGAAYTNSIVNSAAGAFAAMTTATIQQDGDGNYLKFASTMAGPLAGNLFVNSNFEAAEDKLIINGIFSGTNIVKFLVDSVAATGTAITGSDLVQIKFSAGVVTYKDYSASPAQEETLVDAEGNAFAVNKTDKYAVTIMYNGELGTYSFRVANAANPDVYAEALDVKVPLDAVANVKIGCANTEIAQNSVNVHELSIFSGTSVRYPSRQEEIISAAVLEMYDIFENGGLDTEGKLAITTIAGKLNGYGFAPADPEVADAVAYLVERGVTLYNDELANCVKAIDPVGAYSDRLANVEAYADYLELIPENYEELVSSEAAEYIAQTIAAYLAEVETLENIKIHAENFLGALVDADATVNDYGYLTEYYDAAEVYAEDVYEGYDGVPEALELFDDIADKLKSIRTAGEKFVESAAVVADKSNGFGVRYEAYLVAIANLVTEERVPGINTYYTEDGVTYPEVVAQYNENSADIIEMIGICDGFIANVNGAKFASYISAQEAYLAAATEQLEVVETEYPGIPDAKVLYGELNEYIAGRKVAAQAYINAVNAIDGLEGDELLAAIEAAKVLQEDGDVLGVDGVIDANIKLSNAISAIELAEGYNNRFVNLVSKIAEVVNYVERYSIIIQAQGAEDSADSENAEVADAKGTLDSAIDEYNAKVQSVNAAFAEVNSVAAKVTTGATAKPEAVDAIGRVISIIIGFFA